MSGYNMKKFLIAGALLLTSFFSTADIGIKFIDENDPTAKVFIALVEEHLRDPFSAKFRNIVGAKESEHSFMYCLQVNSKNGFGAYTGWTNVVFYQVKGENISLFFGGEADFTCPVLYREASK